MEKKSLLFSSLIVVFPLFLRAEESSTPPASAQDDARSLVSAPVSDLRREPEPPVDTAVLKRPYDADRNQESQVIFDEEVKVVEERNGWARVEALEQPEFTHDQKWEGYPGWVLKKDLAPKPAGFQTNAVVTVRYAQVHQ